MEHTKKVIRLLDGDRVEVKLVRFKGRLWGLCDYQDKELFIKKTLCHKNQIKTLIHECLHFLNPSKNEVWVLKTEYEVFRDLSIEEYQYLSNYLRRLSCLSKK